MKKNYLRFFSLVFIAILVITGCKKEMREEPGNTKQTEDGTLSKGAHHDDDDHDGGSCRLVYFDWQYSSTWTLHYNRKGLADKWKIDYGYGVIDEKMYYDNNDRLVKADEVYFGTNYVYRFYYSGKRLVRSTRTNVSNPADLQDFRYTYNNKGQNIRQDDAITDAHVFMYYDALGNCTKTDVYFGREIWYSDIYTFNQPVKNPLLAVPGIEDLGFPFYGTGGFSNKRWFTSNKTIIYDGGIPSVYNDYDPAQTVFQTGRHHYPLSARYYDRVTLGYITNSFNYDNCGRDDDDDHHRGTPFTGANKGTASNQTFGNTGSLRLKGSLNSLKEQIQALRKQRRN